MNAQSRTLPRAARWPVPGLPLWSIAIPLLAVLTLALSWDAPLGLGLGTLLTAALFLAVLSAIHHAEVIAHRVGEPYGSLVLAVAVTVIEVALIVSLMLAGGEGAATARDTVFSAVMIVLNGVVGLCILLGGLRHKELGFRLEGTSPALAVLVALATLTMVLPVFTTTVPGPIFSTRNWSSWRWHRWCFTAYLCLCRPCVTGTISCRLKTSATPRSMPHRPARRWPGSASVCCWSRLIGVVGLAKVLAPGIEAGVAAAGAPKAVAGVLIALIVLLPETGAALRAARSNRMQTSLNLALGLGPGEHRADDPGGRRAVAVVPVSAGAGPARRSTSCC